MGIKEGHKQTGLQKEQDGRSTGAIGVLHLLLRVIKPSTERSLQMRHTTGIGRCFTDRCSKESSGKKRVSQCSKIRKPFPVFRSTTCNKRRSSIARRSD